MHYTLHLCNTCNMRCSYCYVMDSRGKSCGRGDEVMSFDTARAAVDLASNGAKSAGLIFFGGEPLLCRKLIEQIIEYAREVQKKTGCVFYFKITTNGLLLDDSFLELADREQIFIALSMDGTKAAHNAHRRDTGANDTYDRVYDAAVRLLMHKPYAPVLMTINPDTLPSYAESVDALYQMRFGYIIPSLNYAADWTENDMKQLKRQYKLISDWYYRHTIAEDKFYFAPFEVKMSSHINSETYCHERCELGKRQLSVSPDGTLFPCVQFVGDYRYSVGDVFSGIDVARRDSLFNQNETEKAGCDICTIRKRCNHYCACLNKQATGSIDVVSPVLCAHERTVLPIADALAEKLYKERSGMFIQKQYNDFYPLVSLAEDRAMHTRSK